MPAPGWFVEMLGWKAATRKTAPRCVRLFGEAVGPNLADLSGTSSTAIAGRVYSQLGVPQTRRAASLDSESDQITPSAGAALENALRSDLLDGLRLAAADRRWEVSRTGHVNQFAQYTHLALLQQLFDENPTLRSALGRDYEVATDVMVSLPNPSDPGGPRVLHAAVSSKLTIRSDRVQNIRYEFGTLVKNRRGRLPHLVVVTAEPLPSRLVSIARGTGEIDAVYHLLFDEMQTAVADPGEQRDCWREMVDQQRIRPYHELAAALAAG